eukprot:scaffold5956_cov385-Prasinococcus_capsulatus_cf.AAC.3
MARMQPLFPGDSELQQLLHIFKLLGTPTESVWSGVTQFRDWHEYPMWHAQVPTAHACLVHTSMNASPPPPSPPAHKDSHVYCGRPLQRGEVATPAIQSAAF